MVRDYELVFIVNPQTGEENTEAVIERVKGFITNAGGEIAKVDPWGLRRLAYPIRDSRDGLYVVAQFKMEPKATADLERNLKLTEEILRYLLVRLGE